MSNRISVTAATHPVNKVLLSTFDACSDSHLLTPRLAHQFSFSSDWLLALSGFLLVLDVSQADCSGVCTIFSLLYHWPPHPLVGSLVPAACSSLSHKFKNCKSQALSPSKRLTQRVFTALAGVSMRNSSVRSSLPTKNSSHPSHIQLHQCSPCLEDYDIAFSQVLSLENCSTHACIVPNYPTY